MLNLCYIYVIFYVIYYIYVIIYVIFYVKFMLYLCYIYVKFDEPIKVANLQKLANQSMLNGAF